ncbi:MAG: DUF1573 domain-containing protein [Bacteroidota bacterium]
MKKVLLSLTIVLMSAGVLMAQKKPAANTKAAATPVATPATPATPEAAPATTLVPDNMTFKTDVHDFGTIPEGPAAEFNFEFTNTGKEPIIVQRVQASCGCTTPSYSKDPVLPGKPGDIKASYNTNGRIGPFTKTITVYSNAGTKIVTIKGTVEKAPTSSVPENNSMIKTN